MSIGGAYAKGSNAWAICQKCGLRDLLNNLVFDEYYPGLRVHQECKDYKHPQEHLVDVKDPIALWKPAPEDLINTAPVLSANQVTTTINISWTAALFFNGRVESYKLYKAINSGDFALLGTFAVTYNWDGTLATEVLSTTDTAFTPTDVLDYYVVAVDFYNNGLPSNTVHLVTT